MNRSKICLEIDKNKPMYTYFNESSIEVYTHENNLYQLPRKLISFSYYLCMNDSLIPISDCASRLNHIYIFSYLHS